MIEKLTQEQAEEISRLKMHEIKRYEYTQAPMLDTNNGDEYRRLTAPHMLRNRKERRKFKKIGIV